MFGLMRAKKCGMADAEKNFRRVNYCGTCKTIGSLYGQKSRLLLNNDTVFLAELLTALSGENIEDWQNSYQSYNCLNLPKDKMPIALQFAATTNIILAKFKLADHISDEGKCRYKLASNAFSNDFQKAETLLKNWKFPLEEVQQILQTQNLRELNENSLDEFSLPTATATAIFFAHGTKLIGKETVQNSTYIIGFNFGKLIYLLDAFEDYEKDFRFQKFNAFRKAYDLRDEKLTTQTKRKIAAVLYEIEEKIITELYKLPITQNQNNLFASRLSDNLLRKLKTTLPILKTEKICSVKPKRTFSKRWQNAKETAKNLARNYSWQMPLIFLFVFIFALVAPAQSREAKSARECFDLSFNLMFLGAIFGSVVSYSPLKMVAINRRREKKQGVSENVGEGWCDCSCSNCCDCGDGCESCCDSGGCDCCGDNCCGDSDCCGSCDCSCD